MNQKRTRKQNKQYKYMLKQLDYMLGEDKAGAMIAILLDLLNKCVEGVGYREMRTLELKMNNFFSFKYDFEHKCVVEE